MNPLLSADFSMQRYNNVNMGIDAINAPFFDLVLSAWIIWTFYNVHGYLLINFKYIVFKLFNINFNELKLCVLILDV